MNIKRTIFLLCAVVSLTMATEASADTISLVGDKDGFGQGLAYVDGADYLALGGAISDHSSVGDGITDQWPADGVYGYPSSWTHSYVLDGAAISASLTFYIAGFADIGDVDLLVDGAFLANYDFPDAFVDTHILTVAVPLAAIDGTTMFTLAGGDSGDGYIYDFMELTIVTDAAPVPEPGSMALLGLGIAGLAFVRRRRVG